MSISQDATITLSLVAKDLASSNIQKVATGLSGLQKTGGLAGTALKGAGVLAAGGFGLMTAGALQAEGAQGKFMAATGGSRDAAKEFVSGMDSLAGSAGAVGVSFDKIAQVGTTVQQQFGTSGQATTDLTGKILELAKVSGGDATDQANALGDTLAGMGLDASAAQGVMDNLVASNQQFGTSIGDSITALDNMTPALTAMGLSLGDGQGLLNAFEQANVDAGTAAGDLTKAIKNLKPGQNIDDLVAQVGAIEDPILRAKEATKLFGKAAGPEMAAVIKPGMKSLKDVELQATNTSGALDGAANDMLTAADKIRGGFDKLVAGARELGQQFGPALSGIGAVVSAVGPTIAGGLGKAWGFVKNSSVVKDAISKAAGAASEAYTLAKDFGSKIADGLSAVWDSIVNSSVVKEAVGKAGAAAAAAYTTAKEFAEKILEGVKTVWEEAIAHGPIHDAVVKAGAAAGGVYTMAKEFVEKVLAGVQAVWVAAGSPGSAVIAAARGAGLASGAAWLTAAIAALGPLGLAVIGKELADKLAGEGKPGGANFADNWLAGARARAAQQTPPAAATIGGNLGYALSVTGTEAGTKMAAATVGGFTAGGAWGHMGDFVTDQMTTAAKEAGTAGGETAVSSWQTAMSEAAKRNKNSMTLWDIELIKEKARNDAAAAAHEFALGWQDGVPSIHQQWKDFVKSMDHALDPTTEMAWLHGKLTGKRLADGLASNDSIIRARAQNEQSILQKEWDGLYALGYRYGEDAGQGVAAGVRDTSSKASAAAAALARQVNAALSKIVSGIQVHVGINGDQWAHGVRIPTFAKGGHIPAGQLSIVGEDGPELLKPDSGVTVIPRGNSGTALGLSGAQINLSFPSLIPYSGAQMAQAARDFIPELVREMRRQRLLPQGGF